LNCNFAFLTFNFKFLRREGFIMGQTLGIWIGTLVVLTIVVLAFIKANLYICPPNEILIFSGKRRRLPDGTEVGYRIIKGGRGFKIPIVETVHRMSLATIPIEIEIKGAEAVRLMREQWEKGNTRELFLIQQLPDIIGKITSVVSDNLSIEKLTIVDGGSNGGGIPTFVKGVTGSIVAIMEQIKNATGLDIPEILQAKSREIKDKSEIRKEL
jgi:uncharacterized membrane protein YqiK